MAIKVQLLGPLRDATDGKSEIEVAGPTVGAAIADLVKQHPALGTKLFENGKLRQFVIITVNDEDIRYLDEMDTAVTDGVIMAIMPSVAGG
jgi:MoaD family protein